MPAPPLTLWVPIIRSWALTRGYALHPGTSCVASFTGSGGLLARLAVRRGRSKDREIIVLRRQLGVLHRRNNRPQLADEDRALLGAIAAALPRRRRAGWLVTSETLLRWHRRRTARHWTQPSGTPGRPSTSGSLRRLILETANDNPTWGYRRITGELAGLGYRVGEAGKKRVSPIGHRPRTLRPRLGRDAGPNFNKSVSGAR